MVSGVISSTHGEEDGSHVLDPKCQAFSSVYHVTCFISSAESPSKSVRTLFIIL